MLSNVEERLFENIKIKDFYKIDDFKIINKCKVILNEEIEENIDEENNISKLDVFNLLNNYFQFDKLNILNQLNFQDNIKFPKFFKIIFICLLYSVFVETFILKLDIPFSSGIIRIVFNLIFVIIFLTYILSLKIKINKISKNKKMSLKKIFIFEETFVKLKKDFEFEEKEKLLEIEPSVQLDEEEINALLSDIFEKPEIEPKFYDRKASLERRKRRKNR